MKLTTLTKRTVLITTAFATLMSSAPSFANTANTCYLEKQTLESLKTQLNAVETQLDWSKANKYTTAIHGLGTIIPSLMLIGKNYNEVKYYPKTAALALAGMVSANTLVAYNFYLSDKEVEFYKAFIENVKRNIDEQAIMIQNGECLSDKALDSNNSNIRDLYKALVVTNQLLEAEVKKLDLELGNTGEKISTVINVSTSIIFTLAMTTTVFHSKSVPGGENRIGDSIIGLLSVIAAGGSQIANLPSLKMSSKEARALLGEVKKAQDKLKAQENVLREILD